MKELPFANSLTLATTVFYIACALLAVLIPDFLLAIFQSWFHGINVVSLATTQRSLSNFILGLISLTAISWVFGYIWAWTYNKLSK